MVASVYPALFKASWYITVCLLIVPSVTSMTANLWLVIGGRSSSSNCNTKNIYIYFIITAGITNRLPIPTGVHFHNFTEVHFLKGTYGVPKGQSLVVNLNWNPRRRQRNGAFPGTKFSKSQSLEQGQIIYPWSSQMGHLKGAKRVI